MAWLLLYIRCTAKKNNYQSKHQLKEELTMTTITNLTYTLKQATISIISNHPISVLLIGFVCILLPGIASLLG